MKYPALYISILIDLMLVKSGLEREYSGLRNLSELIEDELGSKPKTTKQHEYIHQSLNKKISKEKLKEGDRITVNETYLKEYLDYLEYDDFDDFKRSVDRIKEVIQAEGFNESDVLFIIPEKINSAVQERIKTSLYKGQSFSPEITTINSFADFSERAKHIQFRKISFLLVSPSIYIKEKETLKEWLEKESKVDILPIWWLNDEDDLVPYGSVLNPNEVLKEPFGFRIIIQFLKYRIDKVKATNPMEDWMLKVFDKLNSIYKKISNQVVDLDHRWFIGVFGLFTLLISLILLFVKCPSKSQIILLRPSIAIGITGLFASLTTKWRARNIDFKIPISLCMFLFLYLVNPISIVKGDNCSLYSNIRGKVFLGKHPLEDATISLPQHDFQTFSNAKGEFLIEWNTKERGLDSILIHIQSNNVDTSLYWETQADQLHVRLKDTLIPLSNSIVRSLISQKIEEFKRKMNGNYLKWRANTQINLQELLAKYTPYNLSGFRYRNEFQFESLDQKITFRKNLIKAGINEVKEVVAPYRMHEFDSCSIFLLEARDFPNYRLDYLMKNSKPIDFRINRLHHIDNNHYKVSISYLENIRDIRVNLNCSRQTNNYKIRQMEVYGFLPTEDYELKFRHGKWSII